MPIDSEALERSASAIEALGVGPELTACIAGLEHEVEGATRDDLAAILNPQKIDESLLRGALTIKSIAAQVHVIIHAVGILVALPSILEEGETVERVSLGAGNTGRDHDLETDRQIGEFKFIEWKGGPESIRQNSVFADVFNLASADTPKRRVLYVTGKENPLRFLRNRRAITSVVSRSASLASRFRTAHGEEFTTVRDYWMTVESMVEVVDLRDLSPAFRE